MIRAVLVGVGLVADMHADAMARSNIVGLTGVLSRRREPAATFAAKHDIDRVYSDIGDVAADPDVDMVIVATPPNIRSHLTQVLSSAKKPTLMEKPIERDTPRARAIVAAFAATDTPLGVVFQHRMRGSVLALKPRLAELGAIGSVDVRIPWWRPQSYYDELGRGTYDRDGGGVLITQAIHTLDVMLHLTGPVSHVQAITATTPSHQMEAEDFAASALRFQAGAVGSVMASTGHYPGFSEEIVLNGTKITARLTSNALSLYHRDGRVEEVGGQTATGGGADPMAFSSDWHRAVIEDFATAVRDHRPPSIPAREALEVHALIDAIVKSSREGRAVSPKDI